MALRIFEALCVFLALCLLQAWAGTPSVVMEDHSDTVLEGDDVTLECLSNEDEDMNGYTFQKYSKWMKTWLNLDARNSFRCWYYDVNITRNEGRLLLHIQNIQPWQVGPYRCVARDGGNSSRELDNATTSESFTVPFYYVRDVVISRANVWCGVVGSKEFIEEGSDVELRCRAETDSSQEANYEWSRQGGDWIVASKTLRLKKFGNEDAGNYTCQARHPVLFNLVKSKSVELKMVEPRKSLSAKLWHSMPTSTSGLLAMFIGIPAAVLLLIILALSLVIRRRMANNRKKAPIEEPEQRSPIYKGSQESLPSRVGDTQPLVI